MSQTKAQLIEGLNINTSAPADALVIDSSGNVGVGTTSPSAQLHVNSGTANTCATFQSSDAGAAINLTDSDARSTIEQNGTTLSIIADTDASDASSDIRLKVDNSTKLIVNSSGNVGIGTSSPHSNSGTNLHIHGSNTTAELRLTNTTTGVGANGAIIQQGGNTLYISNTEAGNIAFENNGAERMRIDSSGRVGIGNTSPSQPLDVTGWVKTSVGLLGTYGRVGLGNSGGPEITTGALANPIKFIGGNGSSNLERMRIDSAGRLLVGTSSAVDTSDEAIVHVVDTLGARLVLGRNDTSVADGNGLGGIRFAGNDTTSNTFTTLGEILCQADGTHAAGDNPTRLTFKTTPDGSSTVTERMRITSAGLVGIGTTSPAGGLHVDAASGVDGPVFDSGGTGNTNHALLVRDSGNSQLLRVNNNGNVGIGTSSPTSKLNVEYGALEAATLHELILNANYGTTNNGGGRIGITFSGHPDGTAGAGSKTAGVYGVSTDNTQYTRSMGLVFNTSTTDANAAERMRIDSSGNVGIGTTSPSQNLHVSATSGTRIQVSHTGGSVDALLGTDSGNAFIGTSTNHDFRFITNNGERMRIDNAGRLLVGATSSADQNAKIQSSTTGLEVFEGFNYTNNATGAILRLAKSRATSVGSQTIVQNNDELGRIAFLGTDGSVYRNAASISAEVDSTPGSSDMPGRLVFKTTPDGSSSPTERMRIDSEGRVHAGGTGAMQLGTICSRSTDGSGPSNDGNQRHALVLGSTQTAGLNVGPSIYFYGKTNNSTADYGFAGIQGCKGSTASNNYTGHLRFFTQNSGGAGELEETCRMTRDGLTFFGDTAAVNALDDYEEGTWTPVFGSTSGAFTSITYSLQVGNYTKIGNRVYIECRLQITAHTLGSASGGLLVAGLPYTVGSPTGIGGNVALSNFDIPTSVVNLAVESRENSAQFYAGLYTRDNTTFGNITPANLKSGSTCEIRASAFYYTNS